MYKLRCTIKCPEAMKEEMIAELRKANVEDLEVCSVSYEDFIGESRMYWDYAFPEMKSEEKPVTYISYEFPDTKEGRQACHYAEWCIGWVPQNIRYVEVNE